MENSEVTQPVAKMATAWAMVGITSWSDFAAFLAAIYSLLLIGEWLWKKAVYFGWVRPRNADKKPK